MADFFEWPHNDFFRLGKLDIKISSSEKDNEDIFVFCQGQNWLQGGRKSSVKIYHGKTNEFRSRKFRHSETWIFFKSWLQFSGWSFAPGNLSHTHRHKAVIEVEDGWPLKESSTSHNKHLYLIITSIKIASSQFIYLPEKGFGKKIFVVASNIDRKIEPIWSWRDLWISEIDFCGSAMMMMGYLFGVQMIFCLGYFQCTPKLDAFQPQKNHSDRHKIFVFVYYSAWKFGL